MNNRKEQRTELSAKRTESRIVSHMVTAIPYLLFIEGIKHYKIVKRKRNVTAIISFI